MIKMADTCKPLGQFPVAEAEDIDFADGESLQKKLDDGSLGGGSGSWNGTREDFEKLDKNLLKDGQQLNFTDDYNKNVIDDSKTSGVSTWSSQKISDELGEIESDLGDLIKSNMKGSEGYLELPNKLCLEWGSNTIASGGTMVEVSLKKLTSYINVQITCFSYAGAHSSFYGWSDSTVKNGFRIYQKDAVTQPRIYKWLAIGTCD